MQMEQLVLSVSVSGGDPVISLSSVKGHVTSGEKVLAAQTVTKLAASREFPKMSRVTGAPSEENA